METQPGAVTSKISLYITLVCETVIWSVSGNNSYFPKKDPQLKYITTTSVHHQVGLRIDNITTDQESTARQQFHFPLPMVVCRQTYKHSL